ncbi:MAG: 4-hydroxy-3-methylbut-2-enyl diphosphate reductase [Alphaproteobacteria bacterium]|nr:4-hydroxy-3-methylbut-2-enyl diphosphate reductase [Alphaproteobacteria bacterium SS10]MBV6634228.1 4-hydroxy-3-methylbut-2-enyl diphosphate reductase [Alphaproteobacteria bacterium SS10]
MTDQAIGSGQKSPQAGLPVEIILAQPRGFCAGVERAIEIVERALIKHGPPVYVRHEIVHNKRVVDTLRAKGAVFVEEVDEVPPGAVTIFSAHGVAEQVESDAAERELDVLDATCPLVSKVHKEGQRYADDGYEVVLVGHAGHPEVEGTMGRIDGTVHLVETEEDVAKLSPSDPERLAYVTQTTLSVDDTRGIIEALKSKFPAVTGPDVRDICYATQNRQTAVRELARQVDLILVVGASNSSNSNRLVELGRDSGVDSYLVQDANDVEAGWLDGVETIGLTAGASAPETVVQEVVTRISELRTTNIRTLDGVIENIRFKLPKALADVSAPAAE